MCRPIQLLKNLRRSVTTLDICGQWGEKGDEATLVRHEYLLEQAGAPVIRKCMTRAEHHASTLSVPAARCRRWRRSGYGCRAARRRSVCQHCRWFAFALLLTPFGWTMLQRAPSMGLNSRCPPDRTSGGMASSPQPACQVCSPVMHLCPKPGHHAQLVGALRVNRLVLATASSK
jgi:hypothetical protein